MKDQLVNIYYLDNHNRITSVEGGWDEFALQNGGSKILSSDVCGKSIWDYVSGDATRMWLDTVLQYSKIKGESIERVYRCDSPELQRLMKMIVVYESAERIRIEHHVLETKTISKPVTIRFQDNPSGYFKLRCSICGRVNSSGWKEPSQEDLDEKSELRVVYTVCDDCKRKMPGIL